MTARKPKPAPYDLRVRGCVDCPFAESLWSYCKHPDADADTANAVGGISDERLKEGATPRGCPLRKGPTTITLKRHAARARKG